jgi:alkylation response protein AidB-like acyl-CoA dehydrogenase
METSLLSDSDIFRLTVRRFVVSKGIEQSSYSFSPVLWRQLGELGVLGLGTPAGGGGVVEIASAMEELGSGGFVGPLVEGFIATHALDGDSESAHLVDGGTASVTWDRSILPWGRTADVVLFVDHLDHAWTCRCESMEAIDTLGRDEWARGSVECLRDLGTKHAAIAVGDIAVSGYVLGAANRMLQLASEYARDRRQFGKSIGEFQAVSHPLARCLAKLHSARQLLARCVTLWDQGTSHDCSIAARSKLLSTAVAKETSHAALQVHGAMGFVEGTLLTHLARRVHHVSLLGAPQRRSVRVALSSIIDRSRTDDTP